MTVAGELVSSVVETFVTDGFKRGYQEIKSAIRRRHSIDQAITGGEDARDARLKKAIRDLEVVIGSARGELTESVAAFIREVEKSAIPEAIIRCVLTNGDPGAIYPAFQIIYNAFTKTISFDPKFFFDALFTAIKLRAEQQVKDPGMLEFVQAQNKEIARQLAELARALRTSSELTAPLSVDEIYDSRLRLARAFEYSNRFLTVETVQGAKRCRIKQLVVPPRLATVAIPTRSEVKKARAKIEETRYTPYLQFKTTVSRGVILGDPGGGKSTLTQLLCFDNSNSIILEASFPGKPQIDSAELRVPLRVVLRSFDKRRQGIPGYNLFSHLVDEIREIFDEDIGYCTRLLRHFLTLGNALLIFDGLDEILEIDRRREVVALIEQFTSKYAACSSIVTSRFVGYWDAPLSEDFSVYHLATFDEGEVATFAYKFLKIIEALKKTDAEKKAKRFLAQTNNIASDLRENPLMLGLMVYLFVYRGDVPSNRPEIYKECATLMFEKWDQRRDIIFKIPTDFDLLDLFSYLASKIFGSAETEDGVSREWLTSELRKFFESWYLEKAKALQAARSLVDFITGRAWVMYDVGPNVFKFTHRTFLEYFFARHLLSSSDSIATLIRQHLLSRVRNSEWDVIAHLAVQTAVFRDAGKMVQAAETIASIIEDQFPDARSRVAFLTFVAKALEYLLLPERQYFNLIKQVVESVIGVGALSNPGAVSVFSVLISSTRRRETIAQSAVCEVIKRVIRNLNNPVERTFAMFVICVGYNYSYLPRFFDAPAPAWQVAITNSLYFEAIRNDLQPFNRKRAFIEHSEARLYLYAHQEGRYELYQKFGLDAFYSDGSNRIVAEVPDLIQLAICEAATDDQERQVPHGRQSSATDAVKLIDALFAMIMQGKRVEVGPNCVMAPSEEISAAVTHILYDLATRRRRANVELLVRALLVFALCLDIMSVIGRPEIGERSRLLAFMPSGAMKEMLAKIQRHPLAELINRWNGNTERLAKEGNVQGISWV